MALKIFRDFLGIFFDVYEIYWSDTLELVAYDFYARVVKDCKRTSERNERVSLAIFHNN